MRAKIRQRDDERTMRIKKEVSQHTDRSTQWLLITYDKNFWDDARKEYETEGIPGTGQELEFVSNGYKPPETIYIANGTWTRALPKSSEIERARVSGKRREWIVGVVGRRLARLDIVVLKGSSHEANAETQLKIIFRRMQGLLE